MDWSLVLGAIVVLVVVIAAGQYHAAKGTYRPLSSRQPQRHNPQTPELGMEAMDMAEVRRVQRRNQSLERTNDAWTRRRRQTSATDTGVDAMPDDETYARRFHTAFMKNKD